MQSAGVWAAVSSEEVSHEMDRDALLAIYQGVPEDVLASLAGKDTAKAAWEAIKAVNIGHDRVRQANLQTLRRAFEALGDGGHGGHRGVCNAPEQDGFVHPGTWRRAQGAHGGPEGSPGCAGEVYASCNLAGAVRRLEDIDGGRFARTIQGS